MTSRLLSRSSGIVDPRRFEVELDVVAGQFVASFPVDRGVVFGIDVVAMVRTRSTPPVMIRRRDRGVSARAFEPPVVAFRLYLQLRHTDSTERVGLKNGQPEGGSESGIEPQKHSVVDECNEGVSP